MLMWVGGANVEATSTPFTVTMFWVMLPLGEKMYRTEVWEAGETTGPHCMREGGESHVLVKIPRGFPVQVSMSE